MTVKDVKRGIVAAMYVEHTMPFQMVPKGSQGFGSGSSQRGTNSHRRAVSPLNPQYEQHATAQNHP